MTHNDIHTVEPLSSRRRLLGGALGVAGLWPLALRAQAPATSVQLALPWAPGRDPSGFLVSEKYDGVRAVWDGRTLRFRSGRPVATVP